MEVVPKMDIIYDIFHRQEDRMSRVRAVKVVTVNNQNELSSHFSNIKHNAGQP